MKTNAPVSHTCPDIDAVIQVINEAQKDLARMVKNGELPSDVKSDLDSIQYNLKDLIYGNRSALEQLRENNTKLREWGEEQYSEVQRLEDEIIVLNEQLKALAA